ncbi:MAG: hypothetical protein FWC45_07150, partial [Treponema sp.]|nr:hypothetical protein [Treponema sp.]
GEHHENVFTIALPAAPEACSPAGSPFAGISRLWVTKERYSGIFNIEDKMHKLFPAEIIYRRYDKIPFPIKMPI